jgi:hypothetical protein
VRRHLSLPLAAALAACSAVLGLGGERRPGVIAFHNDPVVVDVPGAALVGIPFEVAIRTYGGGCISQGETLVRAYRDTVHVRPYDIHGGADICTLELVFFDHRATVTLRELGERTIAFYGLERPGDSELVVTREVLVQ